MEEWRPVPGFESRYEVSNFGRVRSLPVTVACGRGGRGRRTLPGRVLRPGKMNRFGHVSVVLGRAGGSRCVHELVLLAFVGPKPPKHEARHLDTDGSNNRLSNLVWGTTSDNNKDVTRNGKRRITYEQADEIRRRVKVGEKRCALAAEFGMSASNITWILSGKYYAR